MNKDSKLNCFSKVDLRRICDWLFYLWPFLSRMLLKISTLSQQKNLNPWSSTNKYEILGFDWLIVQLIGYQCYFPPFWLFPDGHFMLVRQENLQSLSIKTGVERTCRIAGTRNLSVDKLLIQKLDYFIKPPGHLFLLEGFWKFLLLVIP